MRAGYSSLLISIVALITPAAASAQLQPPGPVIAALPSSYSHDLAHDPRNNMVLVASIDQDNGQALGRFFNNAGDPLGPVFVVGPSTWDGHVRVTYSPDLRNGAGGFLVVWSTHDAATNRMLILAQAVSYPGGLAGPRQTVMSLPRYQHSTAQAKLGLAYSPAGRFLLAWTAWDLCCPVPSAYAISLDLSGQAIGAPLTLGTGTPSGILNPEFSIFINNVDVTWNAISGEFGVSFQDAHALVLARVRTDGTIAGRVAYKTQPSRESWSTVAVNPFFGNYVVAWTQSVSGGTGGVASIDPSGVLMSVSPLSFSSFYTQLDLAFSPSTGTFLLVSNYQAREIRADGTPTESVQDWFTFFPETVALPSGSWLMASFDHVRTIASATRSGGCVTPNPFGGGGNCYNGGWLPPGVAVPPPPPPRPSPAPGGCVTPDPFAALGGGNCVNGGWLPPTQPPPPPPPPPGQCITPDPFISIPGMAGICINGGWIPTKHITVAGTMRYFASDDVWAIDAGNNVRHQLAVLPPIAIRVDGLAVTVSAKIRYDVPTLPGYFQVLEITAVLGPLVH